LYQSRAQLSPSERDLLLKYYIDTLSKYISVVEKEFEQKYRAIVLLRTLQTIGAYGYRGLLQKKKLFLKSIPKAMEIALAMSKSIEVSMPELNKLLCKIIDDKRIDDMIQDEKLKVTIASFSYKRGIPPDNSGNGGGFVFDCRGITNPGKYEEYKQLTGKDKSVIDFLESNTEVTDFLQHVSDIVALSINKYMTRGFTNLMISFGCTGGRHRSVYCAEHIAEFVQKKFDVNIELIHHESASW